MKRSTNKKGFTIVELVIVIAVIAILAAVLIPTFASLVEKANRSADTQAVRQMNTYLAAHEVDGEMDITDVYAALEEGGMTAKDYKALATDHYFFWDSKLNRVIYTEGNNKVIYPEEYADVASGKDGHQWISLNSQIKGDSEYTKDSKTDTVDGQSVTTTTITVNSGAQLYQAVQDLAQSTYSIQLKGKTGNTSAITANFQNSINESTTIKLTGDIDMMGGSLSIGAVCQNVNLVIDGDAGNGKTYTIRGVSNLDNAVDGAALNSEGKERNYYSGLVKYVDEGASVTFKNITIDNVVTGNTSVGSSGILVGNSKGSLSFENVTITNSTLYGKNKLGALVGGVYAGGKSISVQNVSLDNVHIISTEGEAGILFGSTENGSAHNANVKLDSAMFDENGNMKTITNCSVTCTSTKVKDAEPASGLNKTLDGKIVEKGDTTGAYRVTTAYIGFDGSPTRYTDNCSNLNPINTYEQAVAAGWVYDFTDNSVVTTGD